MANRSRRAAAMFGAIYEYLSLMGVADMSPARVVLFCAWIFGFLFLWVIIGLFQGSKKRKILATCLLATLLAGILVGLDRWAVRWRIEHPSDVIEVKEEVHDIRVTVEELKNKPEKTYLL